MVETKTKRSVAAPKQQAGTGGILGTWLIRSSAIGGGVKDGALKRKAPRIDI